MVAGVFSIPLGITGGAGSSHTENGVFGRSLPLRSYLGGPENKLLRTTVDSFLGVPFSYERQSFYPLVLYGPTGTGKSHLVRGLLARWQATHPAERIVVTSGREFADGLPATTPTRFVCGDSRSECASLSWLFVDNLDELAGRHSSQQALCAVIDEMELVGARFVGIARRRPVESGFDAALVSRLSAGLSVRVHPPELATRTALLGEICDTRGISLESRAAELLANALPFAFPQLRRAVLQLESFAAPRRELRFDDAELFLAQRSRYDALKAIARLVAQHSSVSVGRLKGPSRARRLVSARGLFVYLARHTIPCSFADLGRFLGGRDRSTVSHAFVTITKRIGSDPAVREAVEELKSQLTLHNA